MNVSEIFIRRPVMTTLVMAAVLICLISGCAFQQSQITRTISFRPYVGQHIGEVEFETFLRSRVACIATCEQSALTNKWKDGVFWFPDDVNVGCAAMIDPRGYFLTAAHCLVHKNVYLIFRNPKTAQGMPARIVWRGNVKAGEPDLAILRVEQPLNNAFNWADEVRNNEPVIAVGLGWTNKPFRQIRHFDLMAGQVLNVSKSESAIGGSKVSHDVPLQSGDSGGPLVDANGRLIGINVEGTPRQVHWVLPKRMFPAKTERPDQKWLQEIIEQDWRAFSTASPAKP
jgi:S1-C subfamily serine protease